MTSLDLLFVIIVLAFTLRGVWTGIVSQLSFIAAMAAGFYAAAHLHHLVDPWFAGITTRPQLRFIIIAAFLFITAYLLIRGLGMIMKKAVRFSLLAGVDRSLGAALGMIKGAMINVLIFTCLAGFLSNSAPFLRRSVFYPWLLSASRESLRLVRDPALSRGFLPSAPAIPKNFDLRRYLGDSDHSRELRDLRYRLAREAGERPRR